MQIFQREGARDGDKIDLAEVRWWMCGRCERGSELSERVKEFARSILLIVRYKYIRKSL